jgi:hypothetical protein
MMFLVTQKRRTRRLGQLIFPDVVSTIATNVALPAAPASPSCSSWDFFFNSAAWQACQRGLSTAQIESVPINAAAAGYPAAVVDVAQAAANQQIAQVSSDVANVATTYSAGTPVTLASIPWYLWAALGVGAFVVVRGVSK